jgi:hypothetical protein
MRSFLLYLIVTVILILTLNAFAAPPKPAPKDRVELIGIAKGRHLLILLDCRPTNLMQMMPPHIVEDGTNKLIVQRGECHAA